MESLVIAGFVRGLSVRDVEASLAEALGPEPALSKSTVSGVWEQVNDEFQAWTTGSLADVALEYLFWTARTSSCTLAPVPKRCWSPGPSPPMASRCWSGWLQPAPSAMLAGRAGHPRAAGAAAGRLRRRRGLIGAAEPVVDHSLRQRCLIHRADNVLAKVPAGAQDEVKAAEAQRRAQTFADRYQRFYPAAVACLLHTLAELTCYRRFPTEHWSRIRHSNLIERTFGETRPRTR